MKKLKRIFCSILVLVSIISLGATASAKNANPLEIAGNRAVSKYTAELRAYVNEVLDNTPEPRLAVGEISLDQIVSDFITQHGNDYDIGLLNKSTRKESIVINDDSRIVINGAVVTVFSNHSVEATPDRIAKGAVLNDPLTRTSGTTPIVSYYYVAYGAILGQELWRVTQEAQFTYTGSSVTVNYSNGYYTRGVLSIWQVSDWEDSELSSILVNNIWTKKVTSSGNFHFGIEYQGVGLVIQDYYVTIDARCTVNGVTSGYCTID